MPSPSINLIKSSDGTGNAAMATVQSTRAPGASTILVDTVDNINATFYGSMGTPHTFVDPITAETITVISEATSRDFEGHVDGTNLEIDAMAPGNTDLGSSAGDVIIIKPITEWANNVAEVLAAAHDDDGSLKDGSVHSAAVLANDVVTTDKILDANVTAEKLSTSAILLGYATRTSNVANATTTQALITDLEETVTVPDGGRLVKITLYIPNSHNTAISTASFNLWDGAVGSGTKLQEWRELHAIAGNRIGACLVWVGLVAAGSKTYRASFAPDTGTETITCAVTSPAILLIELL